jgi:glycosyltransferase involved in cell wall biosynthesis
VLAANTPKHHQSDEVLSHLPGVHLITVPVDTRLNPLKALKNLLRGKVPYNVERFVSPQLADKLTHLLRTERFDVVQVEGTFVAWYVDVIRAQAPDMPVVLRAHNVEHTIWAMLAERERNPVKSLYLHHLARGLKRFEENYLPRFDAVAAITPPDQRRLRALGCPEPVVFVPAGVDLSRFKTDPTICPKPKSLYMIGSLNWLPNLEGLDWFLTHVWPHVHERMPDLELHLAGKETPERILRLSGANVFAHGFVESAPDFMQRYELMIVPLLSGGGMRVKIIEGMALGKCIISTGLGSEGISVQNNHDIVLCDEPSEWINRIESYYNGDLPHAEIGAAAAQTIRSTYDNRLVIERFVELYRTLAAPGA